MIPVHIDPALGRAIIITIPAIAARRRPQLFHEAHRLGDIVLLGRRYEVAGGQISQAWRVANALDRLRSRR